jgi:predicted extracellular nuclease
MCAAAIAPLLAVSAALLNAPRAQATSTNVVISEVYGGGGNSLSIWTNDFVELCNRSDAAVDVSGWVVQYYSSNNPPEAIGTVFNRATLTGSVAPHHTYLVRMSAGTGGTTPLSAPDATGTAANERRQWPGRPAQPGRIAPTNVAWKDSRKPLAAEFTFRDKTIFVIASHFASKGGDDPLFGQWQQPLRSSEKQRHLQAREVRSFLDQLLGADAQANVVVLGNINDFEFSTTINLMVGSGPNAMVDLPRELPLNERYSYVFEGNSQVLDQILLSKALTLAPPGVKYPAVDYDIVHANSEFHDQDADNDPQGVRLAIRGGIG